MAKYSKYVGVSFDKRRGKWIAAIKNNGKCKFLGYFSNEEEAFLSRKRAEREMSEILSKNIMAKKKKDIIEMYSSGKTVSELSDFFHLDRSTIYEHLYNSKTEMRNDSLKECDGEVATDLYKSGMSINKVSKEMGVNYSVVSNRIKKKTKLRKNRKYLFRDENFLKDINESWKAYFLGLLWADGNMRELSGENNQSCSVNISLIEKDSYLLERLGEKIFFNKTKLAYRKATQFISNINGKSYISQPSYKLLINSKIVYQDLLDLGCHPKKSLTIEMPPIPEKYLCDFVRGYFDGDGWITSNNSFGIIGSHVFCEQMKNKFDGIGIKSRITTCGKVSRLRACNYNNLQKFHDFIYQNDSIHMTRKKERIRASLAKRKIKAPK